MTGRRRTRGSPETGTRRRVAVAIAAAALAAAAVACGLVFWGPFSSGGSPGPRTAVIVDQLSLTQPNPAFAEAARSVLEQAGYLVDDFEGNEVTVEFYSGLPLRDYDLVILRVHSGQAAVWGEPTDYVGLFTGEPYNETKYAEAEDAGLVGAATYYHGSERIFGISPEFITSGMWGKFHDTTVIMMGCDGLKSETTARAFIDKGAKAVVGWSGRVSASHTDAATENLLQHLLIEGHAMRDAVALTMAEVGPDPDYGSTLLSYP
jgi:hypothetical protein